MAAQDFKARMIWCPQTGQQNRADYTGQQQEIPFAVDFDFFFFIGRGRSKVLALLTVEVSAVNNVENGQQNHRTDQYRHQHVFDRPHEIYAFQES